MPQIISVHSFRGGTGKSNTTANLATLIAAQGWRVGVVDTDIQSPGIHVLFGLTEDELSYSLNDYLWGKCAVEQAAYNVTARLNADITGQIFLIPSSIKAGEIARIVRDGYDVSLLNDGFYGLIEQLKLDVLLIDTHPGITEETLLSIAVSDALVIILRPDQQDYLGTGVTVQVARKLEVPRMLLLVNKVPHTLDEREVKATVERTYGCEVAGVLYHADEMMGLGSSGIFSLRFPEHPLAQRLRRVASKLMG